MNLVAPIFSAPIFYYLTEKLYHRLIECIKSNDFFLKLEKYKWKTEVNFLEEFSLEIFFNELFQVFWSYFHLPPSRVVQYLLQLDKFAGIWLSY